jgi:orotidine-5'-phosphate decarboxylase
MGSAVSGRANGRGQCGILNRLDLLRRFVVVSKPIGFDASRPSVLGKRQQHRYSEMELVPSRRWVGRKTRWSLRPEDGSRCCGLLAVVSQLVTIASMMTTTSTYTQRLCHAVQSKRTCALVGLDPRFDWLPADIVEHWQKELDDPWAIRAAAFEEFCVRIIDVVAGLVPAVKPQAAFFEELGPDGTLALARVMRYARAQGLMVICDAKRGDIGTTAEAYARAYLAGADPHAAPWAADALTVNPYLGFDTLQPFIDVAVSRGAGLYVLVKTSNPGSADLQDRVVNGQPLYRTVADRVEALSAVLRQDHEYGPLGAVVGATYPAQLQELRTAMPHVPLLVPGYGSQGGTADDVRSAVRADGQGALINSSRAINFAFRSGPFAEQFGPRQWEAAVEAATRQMIADLSMVHSAATGPAIIDAMPTPMVSSAAGPTVSTPSP